MAPILQERFPSAIRELECCAAVAIVCGQGPASWSTALRWGVLVGSVLLLVLFFFRTRQRGFYYVREVLLTAERVIDQKPVAGGPVAAAPAAAAH